MPSAAATASVSCAAANTDGAMDDTYIRMVTIPFEEADANPATRDWTVTASTYATMNEMYGNRTVCGIGRGDSAVRVTNGKPTTLATMGESIRVIRELGNGHRLGGGR